MCDGPLTGYVASDTHLANGMAGILRQFFPESETQGRSVLLKMSRAGTMAVLPFSRFAPVFRFFCYETLPRMPDRLSR